MNIYDYIMKKLCMQILHISIQADINKAQIVDIMAHAPDKEQLVHETKKLRSKSQARSQLAACQTLSISETATDSPTTDTVTYSLVQQVTNL